MTMPEESEPCVTHLTEPDLLALLQASVASEPTQRDWARKHGVSPQYLCDVLRGNRSISSSIAAALGYQPIRVYVPLDAEAPQT